MKSTSSRLGLGLGLGLGVVDVPTSVYAQGWGRLETGLNSNPNPNPDPNPDPNFHPNRYASLLLTSFQVVVVPLTGDPDIYIS